MQEYASQDVLYLPRVYEAMKAQISKAEKKSFSNRNLSSINVDVSKKTDDNAVGIESSGSDFDEISTSTRCSSNQSLSDSFGA